MDIATAIFWLSFVEMAPSDTTVGSRPGQIVMRKVDGWQTLAEKPSDEFILETAVDA